MKNPRFPAASFSVGANSAASWPMIITVGIGGPGFCGSETAIEKPFSSRCSNAASSSSLPAAPVACSTNPISLSTTSIMPDSYMDSWAAVFSQASRCFSEPSNPTKATVLAGTSSATLRGSSFWPVAIEIVSNTQRLRAAPSSPQEIRACRCDISLSSGSDSSAVQMRERLNGQLL